MRHQLLSRFFRFSCLFTFFLLLLSDQSASQQFDRATEEYLKWAITGGTIKPVVMPHLFHGNGQMGTNPEIIGDAMTELEQNRLFYGNESGWPGELRAEAARKVRPETEETKVKGNDNMTMAPPSVWTLRGPIGMRTTCGTKYFAGRVSAIEYSPQKGLYVGAAGGGLWGPSFIVLVPLTDGLPTQSCGAVAVHPVNSDTIYYGTGMYSTQAGGGGTGVYRSTNGGSSWTLLSGITPTPDKVSRILIAPWDDNTVFVAGNTGIWKSTDNGDSWTRVTWQNISDLRVSSPGTFMLAGVAATGVLRSTDQGDTWNFINDGLATDTRGYVTIGMAPSNPNRAYALIARPFVRGSSTLTGQVRGIYMSDNVSQASPTWTDVTPTGFFSDGTTPLTNFMYGQGWVHNAIAVDPDNYNKVFVAGGAMLKSTNGGTSWSVVDLPHADVKVITFRESDNLMYVGGDGGIYTTTDEGATWSTGINATLPITMFYNIDVSPTDDDVVFGSSQDNATEGTRPGNRDTWLVSNIADGIDANIDWSTSSTVFASTQFGDVFRTTTTGDDCGQWPYRNPGLNGTAWSTYIAQSPANSDWIYYNAGDTIYYSTDQGGSWGVVNAAPLQGSALQIDISSDGYDLYILTNVVAERLVRYRWNGSGGSPAWNYNNISAGTPAIQPVRVVTSETYPGRAYALFNFSSAFSSFRIFRTADSGASWQDLTGDFTAGIPLHDLLENPNDSLDLFLGTDLGVYHSTDGGTDWQWWNRGMPFGVIVKDLEYAASGGGDYIVAGTFGRSVYERDVNAPATFLLNPLGFSPLDIVHRDNVVVIGGDSGRVGISVDLGASWNVSNVPSNVHLYGATVFDTSTFLLLGQSGGIFRTTDGGSNWDTPQSPDQFDILGVDFTDEQKGFAVGSGGKIIRTTDAGQSWSLVTNGFTGILFDVAFADPDNGFAVGVDESGQSTTRIMLRSTDGGATWNPDQTIPTGSGYFYDVFFADKEHGFVTRDDGSIARTTDGGGSWSTLPTGYQNPLYACQFIDPEEGWACGASGTMLHTTDGGESWSWMDAGTQDDLPAMTYAGGYLFTGGSTGVLTREVDRPVSISYGFNDRWNIMSMPLKTADSTKSVLFPGATSDAYSYAGQYVSDSVLRPGPGYWLKFSGDQTADLTGYPIPRLVVEVEEGWNMVGAVSSPVAATDVTSDPPGIISSAFFGYDNGYSPATYLEPSRGYWVKASQAGAITLDAGSNVPSDSARFDTTGITPAGNAMVLDGLNELTLTDAAGNSQTLYFSVIREKEEIFRMYEMPPAPPAGSFDVRFATGRMAEYATPGKDRILPVAVSGARYPVTLHWSVSQGGAGPVLFAGDRRIVLSDRQEDFVVPAATTIVLDLADPRSAGMPASYALGQNYPNPFNPSTVIEYALPEKGRVRLEVFDVLGRKVATLSDGIEDAGFKQVEWNARQIPTGMYFYRIQVSLTEKPSIVFSDVRKMLLLK